MSRNESLRQPYYLLLVILLIAGTAVIGYAEGQKEPAGGEVNFGDASVIMEKDIWICISSSPKSSIESK